MLNSVRYSVFFVVIRNVHWLHALVAPTIIVWLGPSMMSDRKSTAYETDIVDPLRASGRFTLNAEVIDDTSSSATNHAGCGKLCSGKKTASRRASDGDDRGHVNPGGQGKLLHPEITLARSVGISLRSILQNVGPLGVVLTNARKLMTEKELRIQNSNPVGSPNSYLSSNMTHRFQKCL